MHISSRFAAQPELEDELEELLLDVGAGTHIGSGGGLQKNIASTQHAVPSIKHAGVSPELQFGKYPSGQNVPLSHIAPPLELDEDEDELDEELLEEVALHIGSRGG